MLGIKLEDPTPSNTFAGVHFILLGFDPLSEQKIGSKLVNGGGVDVGHYGPVCTHVIVNNLVYDDPICVAARRDGKVLVTGLWVDHSFDVGMPVDPTSVMYRPLKGRDGIPVAKTLLVCLTGYQRQDRDDIMTMVGLMGANFSKPLVANKVTHLICYKFEGEKYELAKKMKRIKLVNHRWLEDCLKAWEILPEADYDKSGYELEMMEAEAKDSEEEDAAQEHNTKQNEEMKIAASPNPTAKARVTPQSKENLSSTPQTSYGSKGFPNVCNGDVTELASRAESVSAKKMHIQDIDTNIVGRQIPLDLQGVTYDQSYAKTPTSAKVGSNIASHSDGANSISKSSSKKTDSRNTFPVLKKEIKSLSSFSKVDVDKFKASDGFDNTSKVDDFDGFDNSLLREEQSRVGTENGPGASPPKEKATSMYGKRKMDISYGISKSPKINCDSKACKSGTPSASNSGVDKNASLNFRRTSPVSKENASSSPRYASPVNLDKENEYNIDPQSLSKSASKVEEPRSSSNESVNMGSAIERSMDNIMGNAENASIEAVNPQRQQNEAQVPSPKANILGLDKTSSPTSDILKGKDGDSLEKPARKKTIAKRTWNTGSRPKVALRKAKNQKGSIYINDVVAAPIAGNDDCEKADKLPSNVNVDEAMVTEMSNVEPLDKEHMDDETEAPEDKEEDEVQGVFGEEKSEETNKMNMTMEDRSECTVPSTAKADHKSEGTPYEEEGQANFEVSGGKIGVDELAIDKGCELEKPTKSLGKRKAVPFVSGKRKAKEWVSREESENKMYNQKMGMNKEKQSPSPSAKAEGKSSLEKVETSPSAKAEGKSSLKKVENSMVVEKESRPVVNRKSTPLISAKIKSKERGSREEPENKKNNQKMGKNKEKSCPVPTAKIKRTPSKETKGFVEVEKENRPVETGNPNVGQRIAKAASNFKKTPTKIGSKAGVTDQGSLLRTLNMKSEPTLFLLTGHRLQRKEFQQVIKRLKGRVCRDSHKWSYEATHFINPDPLRRTEKFFAAAASGRWILKTDYLTACNQAGKFLAEEPYEWHKKCLSEDGAINLEAPRKWRLLRERTGHGAFYGMRVIIYGECIAPSLETLKRVIKAGDGTIVATSPPYTKFLNSGVDYAIVSSGMPHVDMWVQEFLRNEIPCIVADYLVEYVCKPGYPLDKHVLYNTQSWAEKSFAKLQRQSEEVVLEKETPEDDVSDDIRCDICGSSEREEVMLICGDESGSFGCGVGTHIDCCNPPFENVPDEDWFCPKCVAVESKKSECQSKKGRSRSKAK